MKDFVRVFIMLILVFGGMGMFIYLGWILGSWGMAAFSLVISVVIIVLFIRFFPVGK